MKKLTNLTHKFAAIVTVSAFSMQSKNAFATNFSTVTDNVVTSTATVPKVISIAAYITGAVFIVAGVLKLKQHVDNPGNAPMKDALVRLGVGAGLVGTPALISVLQGSTFGTGGSTATFKAGFGPVS